MDTTTTSFTVAVICTAALAAMVFALGFNVSRMRGVTAQQGGSQMPTDPASPLLIAQRAHGNAIEYVPTLIALFLLLGGLADAWWVVALIVAATAARVLHAAGMITARTLAAESHVRLAGAMGTYLFGVLLAGAAVVSVV